MERNLTDIWTEFFCFLPQYIKALKPYAKRSGISVHSAMLLTVYCESPDIDIPVRDEFIAELKDKGLIYINEGKAEITSKGSILAKSFIQIRKQNLKK